jgi:hypothetical protein
MYPMVVDGTPKRGPPYTSADTSAERIEEPGDRPDRRVLRRSAIGRQWCLALAAAIVAIIPSGTAAGNVAPQPAQHLMLIANHGDQAVEVVASQGTASSVKSVAPATSEFYKTYPGVSWEIRRNGTPICGGVISQDVTHARIDPPAAPAGWIAETIEGFKIKLSADLVGKSSELYAAHSFLQARLHEALDLLPAWTHPYARATLWAGLDKRNANSAMFHIDPMMRQSSRSVPFDHLHPSMWFGIVVPNIKRFREANPIYPLTLVHEFAHAFHVRALGYYQPDIKRAYDHAVAKTLFKTTEATRDEYEYFAILSEAYLGGRSDTEFSFSREQLKTHDPDGYDVVRKAWTGKLAAANGVVTVDCRQSAMP